MNQIIPDIQTDVKIQFSIVTNHKGDATKVYSLGHEGALQKKPAIQVYDGSVRKVAVSGIADVAAILDSLNFNECIVWGIAETNGQLVKHDDLPQHPGAISRTRDFFSYPSGAGILMLDYDPQDGTTPLTGDTFRQTLLELFPELSEAPAILRPSASSFIFDTSKNEYLIAEKGWRLLIAVSDAGNIPGFARTLETRLWLHGQGYYEVSKSGALLSRCLVDLAVFQPERVDFCAGAKCVHPLKRIIPPEYKTKVFNHFGVPAILGRIKQPSPEETAKVMDMQHRAKVAIKPECERVKGVWIEERAENDCIRSNRIGDEAYKQERLRANRRCLESLRLTPDFLLWNVDGTPITVKELLDNPAQYDGLVLLDPLEPDYDGGRAVAKAYLDGIPYVNSFAHGGRKFKLCREIPTITVAAGQRSTIVPKLVNIAESDALYYRLPSSFALVKISNGATRIATKETVHYDLERLAEYQRWKDGGKSKEGCFVPCDCPSQYATDFLQASNDFPVLIALAANPVFVNGRLVDKQGFDVASGIYVDLQADWEPVERICSDAGLQAAIATVMAPFAKFPLVDEVSRSVLLAAILTACNRVAWPTAPAFLIRSPQASSGKSLIARCLAILAGDEYPGMIVLNKQQHDGEFDKQLLTFGLANKRSIIFDNVQGVMESAALCAWLTSAYKEGRLLGTNDKANVSTRSLLIATGNNLTLGEDLFRRFLTVEIDPQVERPWERVFDFNPEVYCQERRTNIVRAALAILQYSSTLRSRLTKEQYTLGSYEAWAQDVLPVFASLEHGYGNPLQSISTSFDENDEMQRLRDFLESAYNVFSKPFTVKSLISPSDNEIWHADTEDDRKQITDCKQKLADIVEGILDGATGESGNKKLSNFLRKHQGRIRGGYQLQVTPIKGRYKSYKVIVKAKDR